jgi:hypothetical protein
MTTANVTQTGGAATVAVTVSRGLQGATGADGPSNITASTATTINGLLKGNGSTVLQAVAGTDFAAPSQVKSTSFAAANLGEYIAVATLTVTDPSPSEGASFRVLVRNGTATVGGTAYSTAGTVIERVFHSGAWANYSYQIASTFETPAGADAKITAERTAVATLANKTLSSPVLGTPASGTLTNCTGLPQSGVVDLTSGLAAKANLASPTFTGTPTLPTGTIGTTQTAGNSTTALATTAFVTTADNLKANIDAQTHTGAHAFSSTTRPTSAGTGTPAETSLITRADGDARYGGPFYDLDGSASHSESAATTPVKEVVLPVGTYLIEYGKLAITHSDTTSRTITININFTGGTATIQDRSLQGHAQAANIAGLTYTGQGATLANQVAITNASPSFGGGAHFFSGRIVVTAETTFRIFGFCTVTPTNAITYETSGILRKIA